MRRLYLFTAFFFVILHASAQEAEKKDLPFSDAYIGVGMGLDYGGLGLRATFNPIPELGVFAGGGYAFAGIGYNLGVQGYLLPRSQVTPTVGLMYGYNALIRITGAQASEKLYYGTSLSAGIQVRGKKKKNIFMSMGIIVPFRSSEFFDDYKKRKNLDDPLPVLVSLGFHFGE